ncbi:MAG TPA: methyl-accepting chemotaxis protein [Polyangiaceae bacterium]|jgi:methyl-accepting chemotaxis protein|nr:methyl-accepting chemotaxis protein [Polyangiaceae bacterium]
MSQGFDPSSKLSNSGVPTLQGARILAALGAAKTAATRGAADQKSASALVVRQHGDLDALQEAGQKLGARGRDIRNSLLLLRESIDRAKLTALNAGLEGARLGEPIGKALVVMGDEVRNLLARAIDALEEHASLLAEADRDRERCLSDLAHIGDGARELRGTLTRAEEQSQLTSALLGEVHIDLAEAFGTDPEAARILASSAGQVKTLADSLLELSQRSPLGVAALRELLDPLLSLVATSQDTERER